MNRIEISAAIEQTLLASGDWVPTPSLCQQFGISERSLRDLDDRPGLCSGFAISRNKPGGFKHVHKATTSEWLSFKHSMRKHAIKELVRVRTLAGRRHNTLASRLPMPTERDTGQGLFPALYPTER